MDEIDHRLTVSGACFGTGWVICHDCGAGGTQLGAENRNDFTQLALSNLQVNALMGIAQEHMLMNMGHNVIVYEFRNDEATSGEVAQLIGG